MKKIVYVILTLVLVLALSACDNKGAKTSEGVGGEGGPETGASANNNEGSPNKEAGETQGEGEKIDSAGEGIGSENKDGAENGAGSEDRATGDNNEDSQNEGSADNYSKPKHPIYKNDPNQEVIYIREKMFVAQTNDIYLNAQDYLGKKIKYEGMFKAYTDPRTGITYYSVIRYGPGCCGTDMNCGFEVIWLDGDAEYPEDNAWVEVEGVLGFVEGENGYKFLRLDMTSLKVLEKRGLETVLQ